MNKIFIVFLSFFYMSMANGQAPASNNQKIKFLVHITTGADNPTKAALAF